jgi:hypothetical protein
MKSMTKEQWREFVAKAANSGIILDIERHTDEERVVEIRRVLKENPPVDYLKLMK